MSQRRFVVFLLGSLVFLGSGCGRDAREKPVDSLKDSASGSTLARSASGSTGWDEASAGSFVLLSLGDDMIEAALVLPQETDSTLSKNPAPALEGFANASVDLFSAAGYAGTSVLAVNSQQQPGEGCLVWPSVRLTSKSASAWKVGFASGKATSIQIDSVAKLNSSDSLSITIELAKLASASTTSDDPAFRGLPFTVQKAYRLAMGDTSVLVGSIVRKINEEANPREEHLLLVAERTGSSGNYASAFQSRSAGPEDAVRTNAVLAAVRFVKTKRAAIVISFEYDDGGQIALLERMADHDWKISWRSAYTGC